MMMMMMMMMLGFVFLSTSQEIGLQNVSEVTYFVSNAM